MLMNGEGLSLVLSSLSKNGVALKEGRKLSLLDSAMCVWIYLKPLLLLLHSAYFACKNILLKFSLSSVS